MTSAPNPQDLRREFNRRFFDQGQVNKARPFLEQILDCALTYGADWEKHFVLWLTFWSKFGKGTFDALFADVCECKKKGWEDRNTELQARIPKQEGWIQKLRLVIQIQELESRLQELEQDELVQKRKALTQVQAQVVQLEQDLEKQLIRMRQAYDGSSDDSPKT